MWPLGNASRVLSSEEWRNWRTAALTVPPPSIACAASGGTRGPEVGKKK